jgi:hypothetical protein
LERELEEQKQREKAKVEGYKKHLQNQQTENEILKA